MIAGIFFVKQATCCSWIGCTSGLLLSRRGKSLVEVILVKKENQKNDTPLNSSMAANEEEIVTLGKQMEKMRTNEELEEYGEKSDPLQDEGKKEESEKRDNKKQDE